MTDSLVLTFAEIEFALQAGPAQATAVREHLRFTRATETEAVAAAGLASLLARGLCTLTGTDAVPTPRMVAITAGLAGWRIHTEVAGRIADRVALTHLFSGPDARVALSPGAYGQFAMELLDPTEPLLAPVTRFVDACVAGGSGSAVLIRSTRDGRTVSLGVAVDEAGAWFVADSEGSPGQGTPTTRESVVSRISELLGPVS
ncbi:hypothetical protein Lfu02_21680 [Longispora fulva]|uniref:Uncharacterized protein n=1 Tax=Longispora fulva TaxID=619741 RepID=A0A8J7GUL8_9ACTN|nr:hypothetical protein [Longispora fulva]MBG6139820.1 hypothetical protein [Longispora fulva]GIG57796.1 hypothetical protein Lfu02_21680 [Longispora fulva]